MSRREVVNFAQTATGNGCTLTEAGRAYEPAVLKSQTRRRGQGAIPMSERNGDKSRFGRERRRKIFRRKRNRELCEVLSAPGARVTAHQKKQSSRGNAQE